MDTKLTELVFLLDRSGSMNGLEKDTIGGFNGMIEKQKNGEGKINVTTVLFDDKIEIIHDRFPLEAVKLLTEEDYSVRGCTALLDAIGFSIKKMENIEKRLPEEHRAEKIIFVITTDGLENSSTHYGYESIRKLISAKKECGWKFIFLGANIDAEEEAQRMGIDRKHAVTYENDAAGIQENYLTIGKFLRKAVTTGKGVDFLDDDWKKDIERTRDKSRRKKKQKR